MNMGIEPFLVATAVHLICAQRLMRRICPECKEQVDLPEMALIEAGFTPEESKSVKVYKGGGCGNLQQHGVQGPRRPLRSDGGRRGHPRADSGGSLRPGIEEESHGARHDYLAPQWSCQSRAGNDHAGGSGSRNGALTFSTLVFGSWNPSSSRNQKPETAEQGPCDQNGRTFRAPGNGQVRSAASEETRN